MHDAEEVLLVSRRQLEGHGEAGFLQNVDHAQGHVLGHTGARDTRCGLWHHAVLAFG